MRKPFFVEMLIVIVVFACISSINLNLFVKAYQLRQDAQGLTYADLKLQTVAEYIRGSEREEELEGYLTQLGFKGTGEERELIYKVQENTYKVKLNKQSVRRGKGKLNVYIIEAQRVSQQDHTVLAKVVVNKYFRGK